MFDSKDQRLFRLPEFVIRRRLVREERAQTLLRYFVDIWEV